MFRTGFRDDNQGLITGHSHRPSGRSNCSADRSLLFALVSALQKDGAHSALL